MNATPQVELLHMTNTKYRFLTEDEEIKWMMSLQDAKRTAQKNESRLYFQDQQGRGRTV